MPLDEQEIRAALQQILSNPAFANANRTAQFLEYLVESALRGADEQLDKQLNEAALGVNLFDRPSDWDPGVDAVVRNEAGRLRKRLARYYEAEGASADLRIQLPSGVYVPLFVRRGEPGFAVAAPDVGESMPELSTRWYVAAGLLIIAIVVVGWLYWHAFRTVR
jgi:hypothetical protein